MALPFLLISAIAGWRQLRKEIHTATMSEGALSDLVYLATTARIWSYVASQDELSSIAALLHQLEADPSLQLKTPRYVRPIIERGLVNAFFLRGNRDAALQIAKAIKSGYEVEEPGGTKLRDLIEIQIALATIEGAGSDLRPLALGPLYALWAGFLAEQRSQFLGERITDLMRLATALDLHIELCRVNESSIGCYDIDVVRRKLERIKERGIDISRLNEPFFLRIPLD